MKKLFILPAALSLASAFAFANTGSVPAPTETVHASDPVPEAAQVAPAVTTVKRAAVVSAKKDSPAHTAAVSGMSADDAFAKIKAGNARFAAGQSTHPDQDLPTRKELAKGQKPHTIVVSCSDSRVGPEQVFDQGMGQVFVVRTAGEVVASPEIASIEYAIEHLGASEVVVMGHTACGAVKAAVATEPGKSTGSPHIDSLVATIQRNLGVEREAAKLSADPTYRNAVKKNVDAIAAEITKRSKIVRDAQAHHGLKVQRGIYDLETGKVEFWN